MEANLPPDQFLYDRMGPWPQPAPAYPMERPPEVLNIPPIEALVWNQTIGARYLGVQLNYAAEAARQAALDMDKPLPTHDEFVTLMTATVYSRFLRRESPGSHIWIADFSAMELLDPLPETYCAPVVCRFRAGANHSFWCLDIKFLQTGRNPEVTVTPNDKAFNLAMVYALQGAAYHALFVAHPTLHFPMDSVNAITKSAVPHIHPLFQALIPHTAYTLALDNAVLEGAQSVVNNNAPGTWFDPLTADGYSVKQLFGVGYTGYKGLPGYPAYDYMRPWMERELLFGQCLGQYYKPFLNFCSEIAAVIPATDPYVRRWADYCASNIRGFPDGSRIFTDANLANAMAIYMWDVTVAHGADHYSFAKHIPLRSKFLRIRKKAPPEKPTDGGDVNFVRDVTDPEDMARAEMANEMVFSVWTLPPNLIGTGYAFTIPALRGAICTFRQNLEATAKAVGDIMDFMPLLPANPTDANFRWTIPASIQF